MENMLRSLKLLFFIFICYSGAAQDWEFAGTLYQDSYVKVTVEFKVNKDLCKNTSTSASKYRYYISGKRRNSNYYLNWRMSYYSCNGLLMEQTNFLNIGDFAVADDFVESMDYTFDGYQLVKSFYEVTGSNKIDNKPTTQIGSVNAKAATQIIGSTNVFLGEQVVLKVEGGSTGFNGQWVWYIDACGRNKIAVGDQLIVKAKEDVTYFVRAENSKEKTTCISHELIVNKNSVPADSIIGRRVICRGERDIILNVAGGRLGANAEWVWYSGSCDGPSIGKGAFIKVSPITNTTFLVRAEGANNVTNCARINILMTDSSIAPKSILALTEVCYKSELSLRVDGGKLAPDANWYWYKDYINKSNLIGKGNDIKVTADQTSTFFVRAEGGCNTTSAVNAKVSVLGSSTEPASIHLSKLSYYKGDKINLSVVGGSLAPNSNWVWYKNKVGVRKIGIGPTIEYKVRNAKKIYVRAEGACYKTDAVSTKISPLISYRFLNFSLVKNASMLSNGGDFNLFQNVFNAGITLGKIKGSKGYYVRVKIPIVSPNIPYETNDTKVINYTSTDKYYKYTGKADELRYGGTIGFLWIPKSIGIYLGAGYGTRQLIWKIDQFSYSTNAKLESSWAKHTNYHSEGIETEIGLLIKLSGINILVGGNAIVYSLNKNATATQINSTDITVGFGFNF
jgi:hypothetical protein